jgi:hypothetical protein
MMSNVRLRLGDPRASRPGDALLLQQICSHTRNLLRQKQNSGNVWNFSDALIDITPQEDTYLINKADFGTPLAVLTRDVSNPSHIVRLIEICEPQNLYFDWGQPNNVGAYYISPDGSNCSAVRCAFFWKNSQAYVQFNPIPQLAPAQYQIRYLMNANGVQDMALTQEPVEDADADLIEIRASKSLLSNTEWMAPDSIEGQRYNSDKRKELLVTLRDDESLAKQQFDAAQLITTGPRIHQRNDFTTV